MVADDLVDVEMAKKGTNGKRKSSKSSCSTSKFVVQGRELKWRNVTPAADSLSLLVGSEEGGFLSLEEVDGEDWRIPGSEEVEDHESSELAEELAKGKRRKKTHSEEDGKSICPEGGDARRSEVADRRTVKQRKKRDKTSKRKAKEVGKILDSNPNHDIHAVAVEDSKLSDASSAVDIVEKYSQKERKGKAAKERKPKLGSRARKLLKGKSRVVGGLESGSVESTELKVHNEPIDDRAPVTDEEEIDMSAWGEMRLHPLLEKAICELKFREPTPIQKLCIPAAAHKGKDVIGAAETGSGKTLAFGLPILQRLLEEQEKASNRICAEDAVQDINDRVSGRSLGPLRALIITPTRELAMQICEHLKAAAKWTTIRVVPIVGGMATQKQQRLLKQKPEIVVGTPGRLWELISNGENHLLELHWLSFFVLDEADRMVEKGHFKELQSIIDMLPHEQSQNYGKDTGNMEQLTDDEIGGDVVDPPKFRKRRQTLVFSATLALPANFKQKLKQGYQLVKATFKSVDSVAALSERAGVSHKAAIVDLTSSSIVAKKLTESIVEDEDKDHYLYYILKVHGGGRTIVFCTSIAALRRASAILRLLQVPVWSLHAQMQQKARLKAMDRFRGSKDSVLVATDVAARGLDVPGIRTVLHYQLPHSAEIYVHRSGRTARASTDGISIALVSPSDQAKYLTLCRALSRPEGLQPFPVNMVYLPAIQKRVSLAVKVDKLMRKQSQSKATEAWLARNAEAMEIDMEVSEDEDGGLSNQGKMSILSKGDSFQLRALQKELQDMLSQPVKPKAFSNRYITGGGMTPLITKQLQDYVVANSAPGGWAAKTRKQIIVGQEQMEPLEALQLLNTSLPVKRKRT